MVGTDMTHPKTTDTIMFRCFHCHTVGKGSKSKHGASDLATLIREQVGTNLFKHQVDVHVEAASRPGYSNECDSHNLCHYHNRYGNESVQKQVQRTK